MSAILHGASCTLADYFEAAVGALPGHAYGFTVSVLCKVTSQAVASGNRRLFGQRDASDPGWELRSELTNSRVVFSLGGTSSATSMSADIYTDDLNRLLLFTGVWDAYPSQYVRLYARHAEVGLPPAPVLSGSYAPNAAVRPMIGRSPAGQAADGVVVYGVYYALGVATPGHVLAQFDEVMALERMRPCPELPGVLIDLTQDVLDGGGTLPATVKDRGADGVDFARIGAPVVSSHYTRAWAW